MLYTYINQQYDFFYRNEKSSINIKYQPLLSSYQHLFLLHVFNALIGNKKLAVILYR